LQYRCCLATSATPWGLARGGLGATLAALLLALGDTPATRFCLGSLLLLLLLLLLL
jgi:hypothetical protein